MEVAKKRFLFRLYFIAAVTIYTSRHNPQHLLRMHFGRKSRRLQDCYNQGGRRLPKTISRSFGRKLPGALSLSSEGRLPGTLFSLIGGQQTRTLSRLIVRKNSGALSSGFGRKLPGTLFRLVGRHQTGSLSRLIGRNHTGLLFRYDGRRRGHRVTGGDRLDRDGSSVAGGDRRDGDSVTGEYRAHGPRLHAGGRRIVLVVINLAAGMRTDNSGCALSLCIRRAYHERSDCNRNDWHNDLHTEFLSALSPFPRLRQREETITGSKIPN